MEWIIMLNGSNRHRNHGNSELCWRDTSFVARNRYFDTLEIISSLGSEFP